MQHLSSPIITPIGEISWVDESKEIIYVKFIQSDSTIEDLREYITLLKLHFQKGDRGLLIVSDLRTIKQVDKEVRDFFASPEASAVCRATAILTTSGLSKIIGNLFLLFNKPKYPTKLFSEEQKALDWLKNNNYFIEEQI